MTDTKQTTRRAPAPGGTAAGLRWALALLVALCTLATAPARAQSPLTLTDIAYSALPGDRVQVKLQLSGPLEQAPLSFTIDEPARLALDFPGARVGLDRKSQAIGVGAARSVSAVEASDRTRVVFNLDRMVPYQVSVLEDVVVVEFEGDTPALAARPATPAPVAPGAMAPAEAGVLGIDFRRGVQGEGKVVIDLSDPDVVVNIERQGANILVDVPDAALPERLDRRLDVVDFATPVQLIDARPRGGGTRLDITAAGPFEHMAYQTDNVLTVEVRPLTPAEEEARRSDEFGYSGERLSLNFQNIDVRAVLQLIADFTGLNMVASDSVGGSVTLRLKNVPWDQALDIILKSKGLAMRQVGNVIMVAPTEELAAREKLELEAEKEIAELAPLRTEIIQVNYAKARDIAALVKSEANQLLSERGNVTVDERTNSLLVLDTAGKLGDIRVLVSKLDIPVRQVLIESRIVIADTNFAKDLGVRFGYSKNFNESPTNARLGGAGLQLNDNGPNGFVSAQNAVPGAAVTGERYIVDLPVTNPAGALSLAVGRIGSYLLQLELSALQQEGRGEVISSPRVVTANQKEAVIEKGTEIPYQEATSSGATAVSFKKAVLALRVTPQITPDDRIIMDLTVSKDAVGEIFANVPSIDTNSVSTQVLVDNGETVVLGGVYESENRQDSNRVPFFGDLPYLGVLFKQNQTSADRNELLIFITPKILKGELALD